MARRPGSVIAIDHGSRRTGFCVTDPLRVSSTPMETWHGAGDDPDMLVHIARFLEERDVEAFVVGLPFNMDGSEGPRAAEVRAFARVLAQRFPTILVAFQDERLTTKEAEEWMRDAEVSDRRNSRDAYSAMVILRDWIAAGEPR
jgi:putative Holliday junction resolvase